MPVPNRARTRAGVTDFRFHDLRHTIATRLRRAGAGLDVVADVLGHATLTMARRYAHLGKETMRAAMAALPSPAAPTARAEEDEARAGASGQAQRCRIMTDEGPRRAVSAAVARRPRGAYTSHMSGPSSRPVQGAPKEGAFAPHPDDEADVRAGLEEAERGELLSEEESAAYVRSLIGDAPSGK